MIKECKKCRNSVAEVPRNRCYCPDPDDNSKCMLFKPMTNGDRIRAMTDEELANEMIGCPPDRKVRCQLECGCSQCWLGWFRQPCEGGKP